jgi:hypothetical protein
MIVLPVEHFFLQNVLGSENISSCVTVHAMQATGMARIKRNIICE